MDLPYRGHKLTTEKGNTIHHIVDSRLCAVVLTVDWGWNRFTENLTVDEARRLATSLLNDVGLIEDGVG